MKIWLAALVLFQTGAELDRLRYWHRIWVEQAQAATVEMERARATAAIYEERIWWERAAEFQRAVGELAAERAGGTLDAKGKKARNVQKKWRTWQRCQGWPKDEK